MLIRYPTTLLLYMCSVSVVRSDEQEYRLTRYLLANYDTTVRPAQKSTVPLNVTFSISLSQIFDVDERNHILTTNCWLTQIWMDYHLRWNITDFGGITEVRIPAKRVWKPDIILYNNANADYEASVIATNVIVNYTGGITFLQHGVFRSSCPIDVEYFPFDVQICEMKFASWTYDSKQVELIMTSSIGDLSNYQKNGEFDLEQFTSSWNLQRYSCCRQPYHDITYTIKLRRRPMFYVFNLILPCALINGIAMFVFCVPSNSGEKVTLSISTLLSLTVFLMVVRETLPPTQKTPLICIYYGVTITMVTTATALAVVTLNIHYRGGSNGSEVPRFLKKLVLGFMSKFVFVNVTTSTHPEVKTKFDCSTMTRGGTIDDDMMEKVELDHLEQYKFSPRSRRHQFASNMMPCPQHETPIIADQLGGNSGLNVLNVDRVGPNRHMSSNDDFDNNFLRVLTKVYKTIEKNEIRVAEHERQDSIRTEWQYVALICDRFLLLIFMFTAALSTILILLSSPN